MLGLDPQRDRAELRQRVGVQLQESRLPDKRDTQYRKLSGGQKQRLSIVLALVGSPTVAVLDELTTGLDPQARRDTWDLIAQIRDSGVTLVLVTHFMDEAERMGDYTPPGVQALLDAWSGDAAVAAAVGVEAAGPPEPLQLGIMALVAVGAGVGSGQAVPLGVRDRAAAVGEAYRRGLLS